MAKRFVSATYDNANKAIIALAGGRSDRIRTCDLLLPKQARYRAAQHSDWVQPKNFVKTEAAG